MDEPLAAPDLNSTGRTSSSEVYRANAVAERAASQAAILPNRKAMHERSAAVWEQKAAAAEATDGMKRVNEATKSGHKQERTPAPDTAASDKAGWSVTEARRR
jgi:cytochrome c5